MRNLLYVFFLIPFSCFSQIKGDYSWVLGSNGNPNINPLFGNRILDFSNNTILKIYPDFHYDAFNASISDDNGDLLFYSNGCRIYDRNHHVVPNSDTLVGISEYEINECPSYSLPNWFGGLFLQKPNQSKEYILLSLPYMNVPRPPFVISSPLQYAEVVITADNPTGIVTSKENILVEDDLHTGCLSATRHANNVDWWVTVNTNYDNKLYRFLLTEDGFTDYGPQVYGDSVHAAGWNGTGKFSPDGTKYARVNPFDHVYLYDFDRATGEFSNFQQYRFEQDTIVGSSLSFSPSGRFLYVTNQIEIFQLDLEAPDVEASIEVIGVWDGYTIGGVWSQVFHLSQLGPDCRIYIGAYGGTEFYHVIHHPDEKGTACEFEQRGLPLTGYTNSSMPHFPNYRLGQGVPTCDPSLKITDVVEVADGQRFDLRVSPNPAVDEVQLRLSGIEDFRKAHWIVTDVSGKTIYQSAVEGTSTTIQVSAWPKGVYFVQLWKEGQLLVTERIVKL